MHRGNMRKEMSVRFVLFVLAIGIYSFFVLRANTKPQISVGPAAIANESGASDLTSESTTTSPD